MQWKLKIFSSWKRPHYLPMHLVEEEGEEETELEEEEGEEEGQRKKQRGPPTHPNKGGEVDWAEHPEQQAVQP